MEDKKLVYGYYNGKPCYSEREFVLAKRRGLEINSDKELIEFAEKVTYGWQEAGHKHSFVDFYLSDYALSEPYYSLTNEEFKRLKELQQEAITAHRAAEAAKEWKLEKTIYWADNSIEEVYVSKDGEKKSVYVCQPHGDACY